MTWTQLPLWEDRTEELTKRPRLFKTPDDDYTIRLELRFHPVAGRAIAAIEARTGDGEQVSWKLLHSCLYHDDPDMFDFYLKRAVSLYTSEALALNEPF